MNNLTFKSIALLLMVILTFGFNNNNPSFSFSVDKGKFIDELKSFFHKGNNVKHIELFDAFEKQVASGEFNDIEIDNIISTCNDMGERKLSLAPYFTAYINTVNVIKDTEVGQSNFGNWHNTLHQQLESLKSGQYKEYKDFMIFSRMFFLEKKFKSAKDGINWMASASNPTITWIENQPAIQYESTDIKGARNSVAIEIANTKGVFFPILKKWKGQGGLVNWARVNQSLNVKCELANYEIDIQKGEYIAHEATLSYPKYLGTQQVKGTFRDKVAGTSTSKNKSYPKFASVNDKVTIKGLGKGLSYEGGFKMEGEKVTGYSEKGKVSMLRHTNEAGKLTFQLAGNHFSLKNESYINSSNVAATIFFGKDSLYHPKTNAKWIIKEGLLTLKSGDKAISQSDFYDSYHEMYIDTDKINWYPYEGKLVVNENNIKAGTVNKSVTIESQDFYDGSFYQRMQNVASYNPIVKIRVIAQREGTKELSANDIANDINPKFTVANIQSMLFDLEKEGFLQYKAEEGKVIVFDKTFRYTDVSAEKRDYDVIKIKSDKDGSNASVDLETGEMTINGVRNLEFSRRQKVAVVPADKELTVMKDRDMKFGGRLFAGFATLEGDGFEFKYDMFFIKSPSVKYMDFYLPTGKMMKNGQPEAFAIGSRLEQVSGTLLIDAPANKSGRDDLTIFPSFKSKGNAYIYYDVNNKQGAIYDREKFYFELEPFFLQGLRRLKPSDFQLKGKFVSGGIFPEFEETMTYRKEDQSLGFVSETPTEGRGVYSEKGKFNGAVDLSNAGLKGRGTLDYQATTIAAQDFLFTPEELKCSAEDFNIEADESGKIPQIIGEDVRISWLPNKDSMYVHSKEKSFDVFTTTEHKVDGMLIYTPDGVMGRGDLTWEGGKMKSDLFDFGHFEVESKETDLEIKAFETDALAFLTTNMSGTMDFERQFGNFKANDEDAITEMPHNQYKTTLNEFEWNVGKQNLTFVAPPNKTGTFTSVDKKQDELTFEGASAQYDFTTSQLNIGGVPSILVADAEVFPHDGNVVIKPGGVMQKLENARIVASKNHEITKANVSVVGKNHYTGDGYYQYNFGTVAQEVYFDSVIGQLVGKKGSQTAKTIAQAQVGGDTPFKMSTGFEFEGELTLDASKADLAYKGFAKIDHPTLPTARSFFVNMEGQRDAMTIKLNKSKDKQELGIRTGFFLNKETTEQYTKFLMPLPQRKDHALMEASDVLTYDAAKQVYVMADSAKFNNPSGKGDIVQFDMTTGAIKGKGTINACPNLKGPNTHVVGTLHGGLPQEEFSQEGFGNTNLTAEAVAGLNFNLPEALMIIIMNDFQSASFEAKTTYYSNADVYETALYEMVSDKNAISQLWQPLQTAKAFQLPAKDNQFNFLVGELDMHWDNDFQSLITKGQDISLVSAGKLNYSKNVKGMLELKSPTSGDDQIFFLIASPSGSYYYFGYKKGVLQTYSDNNDYVAAVEALKSKAKTLKGKDNTSYELELTTAQVVDHFKRRATLND